MSRLGAIAIIVYDEEQCLKRSVGLAGVVVGFVGPFVVLEVPGVGLRASLPEFLQEVGQSDPTPSNG